MVTVETALVIPVLLGAAALAATVPAVVGVQVRCTDAARDAALLLARGADVQRAEQAVEHLLRRPAAVQVTRDADLVTATVTATLTPPWGRPAISVTGRSVAVVEP
jgi:Flp pilus assembly protein TadG